MRVMYQYLCEANEEEGLEGSLCVSEITDVELFDDEGRVHLSFVDGKIPNIVTRDPVDEERYESALRDLLRNGFADLSDNLLDGHSFGPFITEPDEPENENCDEQEEASNTKEEVKEDKEERNDLFCL